MLSFSKSALAGLTQGGPSNYDHTVCFVCDSQFNSGSSNYDNTVRCVCVCVCVCV